MTSLNIQFFIEEAQKEISRLIIENLILKSRIKTLEENTENKNIDKEI